MPSGNGEPDTEAEPAIAVNPRDPNNAVTTFQVGLTLGASALGFATTLDGGHTWSQGYLAGTKATGGPFTAAADATAAFGPDGTVYATGDLNDFGTGAQVPSEIACWVSHDGGRSWSQPVAVVSQTTQVNGSPNGTGEPYSIPDASRVVVDQSSAPGHHLGRVYVTWDHVGGQAPDAGVVESAYSDDGGRSWQLGPTGQGFPVAPQGLGGFTSPLVLPSGGLGVVVSTDTAAGTYSPSSLRYAVAPNAGATVTGDPLLFTEQHVIGVAAADPLLTAVGRLNDRQDFEGTYAPAALDSRTGRLYVVWGDIRDSGTSGVGHIVISFSDDGGRTWSLPHRVDGGTTADGVDQFNQMIGVGPEGAVYVGWRQMAVGSDPTGAADSRAVDTMLTVSHDGGRTFAPPRRINAVTTDLGYAVDKAGFAWLGDYDQLAVAGDNKVYVARPEALDLRIAGETSQLPPAYHHQRIFVAAVPF